MYSEIADRPIDIRIEGRVLRIARLDLEKSGAMAEPDAVIQGIRLSGRRVDLLTFTQPVSETQPKYDYPMEWDNLAVLTVSTFDEWYKHQIRFAPRGRIRQAERKGVTVREVPFDENLVRGIWGIYNECPVCQGKRSRHYGNDIETVRRKEATYRDKSVFIGAFLGDLMIGFLRLIIDKPRRQAALIEMMSMVSYREKCPANALLAEAVRSCANRAIRFLIYEKFTYGKKQADGLSQFKEVNGFKRVDIPRYYVPLNPLGSLALWAGFHRGLADYLPASVADRMRGVRAAWYKWRFRGVLEAMKS